VIHGRDDAVVTLAAGQLIADGIPQSRMVVIDGCGHVPTLTFSEVVVAEITSFMAQFAGNAQA
jgi:pimeloyl-ACP methyl ester carboxylesterase